MLQSTNAQVNPLPVNSQLLLNYGQFSKYENVYGMLLCVVISLNNGYLSIPLDFINNQLPKYQKQFNQYFLTKIKNDINLVGISYYIKNDDLQNSQKLTKQITTEKGSIPSVQLRALIANKNYQQSTRYFNQHFLKPNAVKKQRKIISDALIAYFTQNRTQMVSDRDYKNVKEKVSDFVRTLSDKYLWESWKKRDDLGYLYQDFYVTGDLNQQTKQQMRFNFWQNHFNHKRLTQINKLQKLGKLDSMKQMNQHPYIQTHFNLNQYLAPGNYQQYRAKADHDDKKQIEMMLYLLKAEQAIIQYQNTSDSKVAVRVLQYQNSMCQDNLNILQQFGLKDYDLSLYDLQQYADRLQYYKKTNGVKRYKTQSGFTYQFDKTQIQRLQQTLKQIDEDQKQQILRRKAAKYAELYGQQQVQQVQGAQQQNIQQVAQQVAQQVNQQIAQQEVQATQNQQGQAVQQYGQQYAQQEAHLCLTNPNKQLQQSQDPFELLNIQFLDRLRVRRIDIFKRQAVRTKLQPLTFVQQLIKWGIVNKQPMAIYMGEKLASQTRQVIPHNLAIRVSDLFSHLRQIDQQFFKQCKVCLSYIGKIERQFIYDINKKYQHISNKPSLNLLNMNLDSGLRNRIDDLTACNPYIRNTNTEPKQIMKRSSKGSAF